MEVKEYEQSQKSISKLPEELLINIIEKISVDNLNETIKNIKNLALTNKLFNRLINDTLTINKLILSLSEKHNMSPVVIAGKINTKGAKQWVSDYLEAIGKTNFLNIVIEDDTKDLSEIQTDIYPLIKWQLIDTNDLETVAHTLSKSKKYQFFSPKEIISILKNKPIFTKLFTKRVRSKIISTDPDFPLCRRFIKAEEELEPQIIILRSPRHRFDPGTPPS